tara:strand:- start:683 stop:1273 length:591 start_codon:yes stop_codon:yes gene_type:complete
MISIDKVRKYENQEKAKNINYHINKLPNELINQIFTYLSLCPFDKNEFKHYYDNKVLFYTIHTPPQYEYIQNIGFKFYPYYSKSLLGYKKNEPTTERGYKLRIYDNPHQYSLYLIKQRKYKNRVLQSYYTKNKILWLLQEFYMSKSEYKKFCDMINKQDVKKLIDETKTTLSTKQYSRFKLSDYKTILYRYNYKYY